MKDPKNRELMTELYRLVEKYEEPPGVKKGESEQYFLIVLNDITSIFNRYRGNEFAEELTIALYNAIGRRTASANKWEV